MPSAIIRAWSRAKSSVCRKKTHPSAGLVTDPGFLRIVGGFGQQQRRSIVPGRDQHPALAAAERRVGHERKAQCARKPVDRLVIVADEEGDRADAPVGHGLTMSYWPINRPVATS
jgi:hypothetical protein